MNVLEEASARPYNEHSTHFLKVVVALLCRIPDSFPVIVVWVCGKQMLQAIRPVPGTFAHFSISFHRLRQIDIIPTARRSVY